MPVRRLTSTEKRILDLVSEGGTETDVRREFNLDERSFAALWKRLGEKLAEAQPSSPAEFQLLLAYERALRGMAEHRYDASQARLRALMDIAPEAVLVVQGRSGRILSANNQAEVLFGYSRRELMRLQVETLIEHDLRQIHVQYRLGFLNSNRKRALGYHPPIFALNKAGERMELAIALTSTPGTDEVMVICTLRSEVRARSTRIDSVQ